MVKIKICGLTRPQDIIAVNEACPDYAGFVFADSTRKITDSKASELSRALNGDISPVGVFVNDSIDRIMRLVEDGVIGAVQLHGYESEDYISRLRSLTDVPIIKSFCVGRDNLKKTENYKCDYLLLDTYDPNVFGGTGRTFGWDSIPHMPKPFFLAGGINMNNLQNAAATGAYCIDVSSGAETGGFKDRQKILDIVSAAREAESC